MPTRYSFGEIRSVDFKEFLRSSSVDFKEPPVSAGETTDIRYKNLRNNKEMNQRSPEDVYHTCKRNVKTKFQSTTA